MSKTKDQDKFLREYQKWLEDSIEKKSRVTVEPVPSRSQFFEIKGKLIRKDLVNAIDIDDGGIITVRFFSGTDLVIDFRTIDVEGHKAYVKEMGGWDEWSRRRCKFKTKPSKDFKSVVAKLRKEALVNS